MKSLIQNCFRRVGYELRRAAYSDHAYETINPHGNYAPWKLDRNFSDTYATIRRNTLVDKYRCYQLWHLLGQLSHLPGAIVEVGVWRGGTGCLLARRAQLMGKGWGGPVYLCDTFTGVVKAGRNDTHYTGGEHADTDLQVVQDLANSLGVLSDMRLLQGVFPEDTAHLIAEPVIRFCHVDVDIYSSAKDILEWVWPRLSVGGIVVADDYGFHTTDGVTKCIDEFGLKPGIATIYNLTGQAILVKTV